MMLLTIQDPTTVDGTVGQSSSSSSSLSKWREVPLAGYSDRLSTRPGGTVRFCLSVNPTAVANAAGRSKTETSSTTISTTLSSPGAVTEPSSSSSSSSSSIYKLGVQLKRSICADPNPKGLGIVEEDATQWFPQRTIPVRYQPIVRGSYATTTNSIIVHDLLPDDCGVDGDVGSTEELTVEVWSYPTLIPSSSTSTVYVPNENDTGDTGDSISTRIQREDDDDDDDDDHDETAISIWSWGDSCSLILLPNGYLRFGLQHPNKDHDDNDDLVGSNIKTKKFSVTATTPCKPRRWYHIMCTIRRYSTNNHAPVKTSCTLMVIQLNGNEAQRDIIIFDGTKESETFGNVIRVMTGPFSLAKGGRLNGRIEHPTIRYNIEQQQKQQQQSTHPGNVIHNKDDAPTTTKRRKEIVLAAWDTSYFSSFPNNADDQWTIPCGGALFDVRQQTEHNKMTVDEGMVTSNPSLSDYYALRLYNHPTRAVKGHLWDGSEFCWTKCPSHYGAIHFHDDDVYDFQWTPNLEWTVPIDIPSGIYIMRFRLLDDRDGTVPSPSHHYTGIEEALPVFVCALVQPEEKMSAVPPPPKKTKGEKINDQKKKKKLAILIPTFTYVMYGNHARPDFEEDMWVTRTRNSPGSYPYNPCQYPVYGHSTYNFHSDGTGIHFASHLRPLLNLRPGYITFSRDGGYHDGSQDGTTDRSSPKESYCSGLRHFPADSHLISWLHHHRIEYEIVTDHELHRQGVHALDSYRTVLTSSHPEYHTVQSLTALQQFRDDKGGNIVYLGGNGFYWKIAASPPLPSKSLSQQQQQQQVVVDVGGGSSTGPSAPTSPTSCCSLLEVRRCESGVRTWAADVGEYYNYLDGGGYGGLWRNSGRPPSKLVGIGFAAQGSFVSKPYHRICWDRPDVTDWVFDGIPLEETKFLGDFGFSGNGAAGYELDRIEYSTDTADQDIVIIAQARTDSDERFILVPEDVLTPWTNLAGTSNDEAKRADMVYFRHPTSGGQIFAVGSITFCGCLPYNQFDNVISKILKNVVHHFMKDNDEETYENKTD